MSNVQNTWTFGTTARAAASARSRSLVVAPTLAVSSTTIASPTLTVRVSTTRTSTRPALLAPRGSLVGPRQASGERETDYRRAPFVGGLGEALREGAR